MTKLPIDISMKIPIPKFDHVSELIKLSLKIFFKSLWFIFKITFFFYIPLGIFISVYLPQDSFQDTFWFVNMSHSLLSPFLYSALIFGIAQYLCNGTFPSVWDAYRFGLHKWARIFRLQYLVAAFFALIGLLMFLIPGILAAIAYSLVSCVVCFEEETQSKVLRRSRELTIGNRRLIFFSLISIFLIQIIFYTIISTAINLSFYFMHLKFLIPWTLGFCDGLFDISATIFPIALLLIYLKSVKEFKLNPKEIWLLRWAP